MPLFVQYQLFNNSSYFLTNCVCILVDITLVFNVNRTDTIRYAQHLFSVFLMSETVIKGWSNTVLTWSFNH